MADNDKIFIRKLKNSPLSGMTLPVVGTMIKHTPLTVKQRVRLMVAEMTKLGTPPEAIKDALVKFGADPKFVDKVIAAQESAGVLRIGPTTIEPLGGGPVRVIKGDGPAIVQNNLCQEVPPRRSEVKEIMTYDPAIHKAQDALNFGTMSFYPEVISNPVTHPVKTIVKDDPPEEAP